MSADVQLWVVGVCVALALAYTVRAGVRKARRVQAGGSACGGCSGDACGSTGKAGGAGCGAGQGAAQAGVGTGAQAAAGAAATDGIAPGQPQPIHWHPPRQAASTAPADRNKTK